MSLEASRVSAVLQDSARTAVKISSSNHPSPSIGRRWFRKGVSSWGVPMICKQCTIPDGDFTVQGRVADDLVEYI